MSNSLSKNFGEKLKILRKSSGLTQRKFAKKVGLTQEAISQLESGKRMPARDTLNKIAIGLNLSIDELLENKSNGFNNSKKEAAIQILIANLKAQEKITAQAVIALNSFVGALSEGVEKEYLPETT